MTRRTTHRPIRHGYPARLAIAGITLLAALAPAHSTERTVPANRTTEVAFLNVYNTHGCAYGARPRIRLREPAHGRITTRWVRRPITANVFGLGGDKCVGRDMYGLAVYYTPRRGFRGTDSYRLRWTYRTTNGYRGFLGGDVETLRVR